MTNTKSISAIAVTAAAGSERELINVLETKPSRKEVADACRELARIGGPSAIKPLAALLGDPEHSHMARYGLESNPSSAADKALREALGSLSGKLLAGVCGSIGVRKDAKAIDALGAIAKGPDTVAAKAAARSLGNIGAKDAATQLEGALARSSGNVKLAVFDGLLRCADGLAASGKKSDALAIYEMIGKTNPPRQISIAAALGIDQL